MAVMYQNILVLKEKSKYEELGDICKYNVDLVTSNITTFNRDISYSRQHILKQLFGVGL